MHEHTQPVDAQVEELTGRAAELLQKGELAPALPLLCEAGRQLAAAGQAARATTALLSAARLAAMLGDQATAESVLAEAEPVAGEAGLLADLLWVRAETAAARGDTATRRAALTAIQQRGDKRLSALALQRLAELAIAEGDSERGVSLYRSALEQPGAEHDRELASVLRLDLAACLLAAGRLDEAAAELTRAESFLGSESPGLRARLLCLQSMLASKKGLHARALEQAQKARSAAVEATDSLGYLSAVALISTEMLRRGEEVEAYDALVRARVSLKDLLGKEASEQLTEALFAGFAERVGDRLDEVRDRWIEHRRALRSQSG